MTVGLPVYRRRDQKAARAGIRGTDEAHVTGSTAQQSSGFSLADEEVPTFVATIRPPPEMNEPGCRAGADYRTDRG